MEESVQTFEPLVTEIHPAPKVPAPVAPRLPAGILRLQDAGREMKKALFMSGLLAVVSLVLLGVLLFGSGKESDVVWLEESPSAESVLVEGP
jgi:hypothetical protein